MQNTSDVRKNDVWGVFLADGHTAIRKKQND